MNKYIAFVLIFFFLIGINTSYSQVRDNATLWTLNLGWGQVKNETLDKKSIELNKANSTKDRLFSIIAHDLKNPFNTIIGFSDQYRMHAYNRMVRQRAH